MRLVTFADTHGYDITVPDGDVVVCAGDFCPQGSMIDCIRFINWFNALPHKHKVLISGNHDVWMEKNKEVGVSAIMPPGIHYLLDSGVTIEGYKFWGSPYQPEFCNWAFNLPRGEELKKHWDLISRDTQILITHGPQYGVLDECPEYDSRGVLKRVGCKDLANAIAEIKPLLHICGHVHYGYGNDFKNNTHFINASICTESYLPQNKPYVVDLIGSSVTIIK